MSDNILSILEEFQNIDLTKSVNYSTPNWGQHNFEGKSSTFVVTDACNLRCSYCYILDKPEGQVMSFSVAKDYADYIFDLNKDLYTIENPIPFDHGKIWDFVGGEPLVEAELCFKIMDYITEKTKRLPVNHPWRTGFNTDKGFSAGYRFSFSTNGTLLNDPKIRKGFEIRGGETWSSLGISVDGPKEIHDLCRKKIDGSGTFDEIMQIWPWYKKTFPSSSTSTKATISHDNLHLISKCAKFFFEDLQMERVFMNSVFENCWHIGDDFILFDQLCELADWLVENERYKKYYISWFSDTLGKKAPLRDCAWCGAGKHMDACGYDGNIYPCLRFKTLYKQKPLIIGTTKTGKDLELLDMFSGKTQENMFESTLKITGNDCKNCLVSEGCADCQGYSYDALGDFYTKATYICPMHKARVVANLYFYGRILGLINKSHKDILYLLLDELNKNSRHSMIGYEKNKEQ